MLGRSHRPPRLFDPGHTLISQNLVLQIKHKQLNGFCFLQTFQLQCFRKHYQSQSLKLYKLWQLSF